MTGRCGNVARAGWARAARTGVCWIACLITLVPGSPAQGPGGAPATDLGSKPQPREAFLARYCVACHESDQAKGDLRLDLLDANAVGQGREAWERVVHKLRSGLMPPAGLPQPAPEERRSMIRSLERALDAWFQTHPHAGRTEAVRRLNRTEYRNAVRDLLALDIDVTSMLPHDESGHGFDNVNVSDLSPALLDRYVSAARTLSRLAVGGGGSGPRTDIVRVNADFTQEGHVPGLPLGSRGGVSVPYTFPRSGEYEIQIWLSRNRNEEIEGLRRRHDVHLRLDRKLVKTFTVAPPVDRLDHSQVDKHLRVRLDVEAGPRQLAVTFPMTQSSLLETMRQPTLSRFNMHRHPRTAPAVFQVSVTGPYTSRGPGDTPSRRRLFSCTPASPGEEEACAREILAKLVRRAYRRPVTDEDLQGPLAFYRRGRSSGGFERGIERALAAVLVSPGFLLRTEFDDPAGQSQGASTVSAFELASRLSFFLWSSLPDDELLEAAETGALEQLSGLESQALRMLADPRASNLASNFASQWLHLPKLESFSPNARLFPDFDDNLRRALRGETERFVESVIREDRSVLDLVRADYTFLNERLAKHYRIPGVYGSRFRRVQLGPGSRRGGLLRHGSVLTVTSYATRTSPVLRGTWILENLFGAPPPPPPPNIPALDNSVSASLPIRERLSAHRDNPACASCHSTIDPVGLAMENYDALGRWRDYEDGVPVDSTGSLPGADPVHTGVRGLEDSLLERPELFVGTLAGKLLTFALGRGVEELDRPAIRGIVREAEPRGYRFSALVAGIVKSVPFRMRSP